MNMLFFQSEESLNEWLDSKKLAQGAVLSIDQLWELSQRWYHNRLSVDYHGRSIDQVQEIFAELGLTSEFWKAA
jgi:Alkylmercury lyase